MMQKNRTLRWLLRAVLSILLILSLEMATVAAFPSEVYAATKTVKVRGRYYQSDARKMKNMINTFRTGKEAWYYNETSTRKVKVKGLKKLTYDYALEKVAMQRAAELSVLWSHTRPNGKSCFSAYPSGYYAMGENIAMGTSYIMSAKDTMNMWKETNEPYEGQGHRRNMLSRDFTCVGVACFEVDGVKYWVQEFGNPKSQSGKTAACNKTKTVKVKVLK